MMAFPCTYTLSGSAALFVFILTIAAHLISPIQACPTNCSCIDDFEMVVTCSGQGFMTVPPGLPKNTKILNLSHNKISALDLRMLYELDSLDRVDISSNEIKTIHGSLEMFKKLVVIDLSQNNIESIPWKTFGNILPRLNTIKLGENPFNCACNQRNDDLCDCGGNIFQCTCNMKWLQENVKKYPTLSWDVTCQSPAAFRGKPIQDVNIISYGCETKYHWIYIVGPVGGVVLIAAVVVAILCRRKLCRCLNTCRQARIVEESYSNLDDTAPLTDRPDPDPSERDEEEVNNEDASHRPGLDPVGDEEERAEVRPKEVREPCDEENEQPLEVHRSYPYPEIINIEQEHRSVSERLPPEISNMIVTEPQLNKLAMNLGNEWENLASAMGVKKAEVDTIKQDNVGKTNVQKRDMFLAWKAKSKTHATVGNLVKELEAFGIDEDNFDFFLDENPEETSNKTEGSETSGPRYYHNEERSAPAMGEVSPDSPATFQVNGVTVDFPERSVERVRTVSVEVEHPVVRNQRQREILQDGVCGPLITVVQSSGGRFQTPVGVTVDLQYPAGSKQSEPNEGLRWHLFQNTRANGWEDVTDFSPQVTDTTIEYRTSTSEFCRQWLVKLTEDAVLSFIKKIDDFIQDYYSPLVVLVMYPGQHGAVVLDCLQKSDPSLQQLVLRSGYNQRCIPMQQTEEVQAKLEGNVALTGSEITFKHPKNVRGDLNKKEVYLSLRDNADPNHRGYITYSIAQRTVTQMPILVADETQTFLRLIASKLKLDLFPIKDEEAETQRQKNISEWRTNVSSDQTFSISSEADTKLKHRKMAVCRIEWPNGGRGSGFLLGKKEILTCDHVYQGLLHVSETNNDSSQYKVVFDLDESEHTFYFSNRPALCRDPESGLDYAILELDSEPSPDVIPSLGPFVSGFPVSTRFVVVIGHPFGGPKQLDYAHMVHVDDAYALHVMFGPDTASYQTHSMFPGSSGSPGFDRNGNVILMHKRLIHQVLNGPSIIEQGTKLTSIVEHARSNLPADKFDELFPTHSSHSQGNPLFGGDRMQIEVEELH